MRYWTGTLSLVFAFSSLAYSDENSVRSITPDDFVPPEFVYIPGDGHKTDLVIEISDDVSIQSPARVSAHAFSGPWEKVRYSEIDPCSTWFVRPLEETDLTSSVEWVTYPPGVAQFGTVTQSTPDGSYKDIHFDRPGEFQLLATTTFPTKATSNTILVTVRQ